MGRATFAAYVTASLMTMVVFAGMCVCLFVCLCVCE